MSHNIIRPGFEVEDEVEKDRDTEGREVNEDETTRRLTALSKTEVLKGDGKGDGLRRKEV